MGEGRVGFARICFILAAVLASAGAARAQGGPSAEEEALARQIQLLTINLQQKGWSPAGQPNLFSMANGQEGAQELPLEPGPGLAAGATCGGLCTVTLTLRDSGGALVAEGQDTGEGWTMEADIARSGTYRLSVVASGCEQAACDVGLLLLTRR